MDSDRDSDKDDVRRRFRAAMARCERAVFFHAPQPPDGVLRDLLAREDLPAADAWDRYGEDGPVAALEGRVAELLGKPAAAFFPSGVMAQQCVLRVWCDRAGSRRVALPDLSHLLRHEDDGPRLLHGLEFLHLTEGAATPTAADLAGLPGPLGAVLVELPLRDGGFLLPTWEELAALSGACRERGVPLHLDGARLWESQPHLGRPLEEVAALADSVYVSFYKGLGGLAGAVVAGPDDVLAEARVWRHRMGGTIFSLHPIALAALAGLADQLPLMGELHARAQTLAEALHAAGFRTVPEEPHTPSFRVYVAGEAAALTERVLAFMDEHAMTLCPPWEPAEVPGWAWTELVVTGETLQHPVEQVVAWLGAITTGS